MQALQQHMVSSSDPGDTTNRINVAMPPNQEGLNTKRTLTYFILEITVPGRITSMSLLLHF